MKLLEKVQKLSRSIRAESAEAVDFGKVAELLSEVLESNVYIVGRKGKILGYTLEETQLTEEWFTIIQENRRFPENFNKKLLAYDNTEGNIQDKAHLMVFSEEENQTFQKKKLTIVPIVGTHERQGTLLLARDGKVFTEDELVLAEYAAVILSLEIQHSKQTEKENEGRSRTLAVLAVDSLSFSELQAAKYLIDAVEKSDDGIVVSSAIADEHNVTRSVIVNSIRKLESAGTLESRSLGMKGTHVKILNPFVKAEIVKQFER